MLINRFHAIITSTLLYVSYGASNTDGNYKSCNTIKGYSGCACQMSDTKEILGLEYLVKNDSLHRKPRFVAMDNENWYYAFHPCGSFDMYKNYPKQPNFACINAAAARFTNESVHQCSSLGGRETGDFVWNETPVYPISSKISLTYRNMSAVNKGGMTISLVCNESISAMNSTFKFVNVTRGVEVTYFFTLESICCCPGNCAQGISVPLKGGNPLWYIVGTIAAALVLIIVVILLIYGIRFQNIRPDKTKSFTKLVD